MQSLSADHPPPDGTGGKDTQALEFLVFTLGKEEYGIHILGVQELRGYESVTHIANAPDFVKGVINLRGLIVPIIDIRIRFDRAEPEYNELTVVMIVNVGRSTVGLVVDGVSDVIALDGEKIKPPPQMGTSVDTDYLIGLGTVDERMIILVDVEKMMSGIGVVPLALAA